MRWVLYVDLDAFYVSCERRDRPELEGRPVIVGPDPSKGPTRGVVLSASYEARANGVHSAMPAARAAQLCPEAIWIGPDFEKYTRYSKEVRALLSTRFGRVLPLSIDEAALFVEADDASAIERIARDLQAQILQELHLPASLGAARSRTVAKIATDEAKPGGVVVVPPDGVEAFLAPLSVRAIPGVGPKTEAVLGEIGVQRIGELRSLPPPVRRRLGRLGEELYRLARGEEPAEEAEPEVTGPQSRSADHTFDRDTDDPGEIEREILRLAEELAGSLAREKLGYRTPSIAIRWADFERTQRRRTLSGRQEGPEALREQSVRLFRALWASERRGRARRVRTVSVGVENLSETVGKQVPLDRFAPTVK
jgi:DNA polymerase IV